MAFLGDTFNTNDLPESMQNFEPIPPGWYTATISAAELCDTKAKDGKYIKVRFDITGPSYEGRVVFTNLNFKNPNVKAEEIGRQQLGEIMRASGLATISDTDQLVGAAIKIKVSIRPASEQYGASNEVKSFASTQSSPLPAGSASKPSAASKPASASAPWLNK